MALLPKKALAWFPHGRVDPLAPPQVELSLISGGASPQIDIAFGIAPIANDVIYVEDNGVPVSGANPYMITASDLANSQLNFGLTDLPTGSHDIQIRHGRGGHIGPRGIVSFTV